MQIDDLAVDCNCGPHQPVKAAARTTASASEASFLRAAVGRAACAAQMMESGPVAGRASQVTASAKSLSLLAQPRGMLKRLACQTQRTGHTLSAGRRARD